MSASRRVALLVVIIASVVGVLLAVRSCGDAGLIETPSKPPADASGAPRTAPTERSHRARSDESKPAEEMPELEAPPMPPQIPTDSTGVSIEVVDENGAPVPGAVLRVWIADSAVERHPGFPWIRESIRAWRGPEHAAPVVLSGAPTNADGLRLVAYGTAPDAPPLPRVEFAIHAGRMDTVRLVATKGRTAEIVVVDSTTDLPVAGARVVSVTEHDRRSAVDLEDPPRATTDAEGRCRLGGLGGGEHELEVHADGYERNCATWTSGEIRVRLKPNEGSCTVTVTVLGPDGIRVPNVAVTLVGTDREQKTDASGKTVFKDVESGFVMVSIDDPLPDDDEHAPAKNLRTEAETEVPDGGSCELVLGVIPAGNASIEALVVDENGAPVPRVAVKVFDIGNHEATAITDGSGNARLSPLPSGSYQAVIDVGGGATWYFHEFEGSLLADGAHARTTWTLGSNTIKGRVVAGADRHGVSGVTVWFRGGAVAGAAHADASGLFELPRTRSGDYAIDAGTNDAAARKRTVKVPTEGEVVVELIEFGRVALRFAKEDRERLRGADAWIFEDGSPSRHFDPGAGDDDLVCGGILPGRYDVRIMVAGKKTVVPVEVKSRETSVVEVRAP
jgi:carboxypeptidase family protein